MAFKMGVHTSAEPEPKETVGEIKKSRSTAEKICGACVLPRAEFRLLILQRRL